MAPELSFGLHCAGVCYIDSTDNFSITLTYNLNHDAPITFNAHNTVFDPSAAFAQGLFTVIDAETGEQVRFSPQQEPAGNTSASAPQPLVLDPNNKDQYIIWETRPGNRTNPKPIPFDPSPLLPDRTYILTLRDHGIRTWYPGIHTDTKGLPDTVAQEMLECTQYPSFTFQTRATGPKPPPLNMAVATSADTVSIEGDPPFTITLKWSLDAGHEDLIGSRAIVALRSIPHGRNKAGVEIRDAETGKRRGPVLGWRPPEDAPPPNEDVEIVRFEDASTVIERSYTLVTNREEAGIWGTDTRLLKAGHAYLVGSKQGEWAWLRKSDVAEDVWGDDEKLKEVLLAEPRVKWKSEASKKVDAVA